MGILLSVEWPTVAQDDAPRHDLRQISRLSWGMRAIRLTDEKQTRADPGTVPGVPFTAI